MSKKWLTFSILASLLLIFAASQAIAQPKAICVPWDAGDPTSAHFTYSGAEITLKGIARGGATEFRWDFGDASIGTSWAPITNPYNLGVKHSYTGVVGQLFLAKLFVRAGSGTESQDNYQVKIFQSSDLSKPEELDVRVNMAIDAGLWYLHTNMTRSTYAGGSPGYGQPYGYWDPGYYPTAASGTSVDAYQVNGHKANGDYDNDPYVETVQRALNYLLYNTYAFNIGAQPAGNPDTNGNSIGLVTNETGNLNDSRQTYIGGICMMAFASSGVPDRIAEVGRNNVYGRTYKEIVQDMVDFFAWGQNDSGSARGGWRYFANYGSSDMSTAQWPPLGMLAAEQNMRCIIPQFVRDELVLFLNYVFYTGKDNDNGSFGYSTPREYANLTKAAAGIICREFLDYPSHPTLPPLFDYDMMVQKTIGYIYRHWNDTGNSWDDTRLFGNSYGMYGIMKAFRIPEPDNVLRVTEYDYTNESQTANTFDWYYTPEGQTQKGLATYNVETQQSDGSWDDTVGSNPVYNAFCTGWRILTLSRVFKPGPVSTICACDKQEYNLNQDINLDGSCSYHKDPRRSIVKWEWDLDNDGEYDDATGVTATIPGGFAVTGYYPVRLRVTDDNPGIPYQDVFTCEVYVHPPPHCPHAFAGGPYIGFVNLPVTLDASESWDPDNAICSYDWDVDGDGLFGCDDSPCDPVGIKPEWTWNTPFEGIIGLRIIDCSGEFPTCADFSYATVDVGNHAPVADPNGPYKALQGACITLDGTSSYDVDPGDSISFAWDLDSDGGFDDCFMSQREFCVGSEIGTIYDICLKVTDSFGESSTKCTTVEIVVCTDADGDGFFIDGGQCGPVDCDDQNPAINPGAEEVCFDGIDNNCDGQFDEGCNDPPNCGASYVSPDCVWAPNNKMVPVDIKGVTDPDGDPVTISITSITSDEATATEKGASGPKHAPDASGVGTSQAMIRAERSGLGDGRVYVINFMAADEKGGICNGSAVVKVPHDQSSKTCPAVDSGQKYDATKIN